MTLPHPRKEPVLSSSRKKTTLPAVALTSILAASAGAFGVPATMGIVGPDALRSIASADVLPVSPSDSQGMQRWVNPQLRSGDANSQLKIELREAPATVSLGETLTVTLRITNNSSETFSTESSQLSVLPKHAEAQTSVQEARAALAQDPDAFAYFGRLIPVNEAAGGDIEIGPGTSVDISLDIPTAADVAGGINIREPGFYPILLGIHTANGTEATQRFLLSVLGSNRENPADETQSNNVSDHLSPRAAQLASEAATTSTNETPEPIADGTPSDAQAPETETQAPTPAEALKEAATPLSVVVPITANVNVVPGETGDAPARQQLILADESLAEQLATGGRLANLITNVAQVVENNPELAQATCLAIDPQLVDALDRMASGYIVSTDRPSSVSQKQRLRDSWSDNDESFTSVPGTGSADAAAMLDQLRALAATQCSVALPWANADINAVADAANDSLMREAVTRGQETLARVLGVLPVTNIVVSPHGYITEAAARLVGWADVSGYLTGSHNDSSNDVVGNNHTSDSSFTTEDVTEYQWSRYDSESVPASESGSVDSVAEDHNALDASSSPVVTDSAGAPEPQAPVRVLVADNTLWNAPKSGRFAALGPKVTAVGYDAGLTQVMAEALESPQTVAYGPYDIRFDLEADSLSARSATAQSALRLAVDEANGLDNPEPRPVLAMLPAVDDEADSITSMLNTAANLLETDQAKPLHLRDYASPTPQQSGELVQLTQAGGGDARFGAPYDDPTAIADTEVLRIRQQAAYVDDLTSLMINDPHLALTPYWFTAPLRQDLLRALSYTGRNELSRFDDQVNRTDVISNLNREVLMELRESVALLPPGNVYTRISDSSPLLIVARNGLPLPVNAYMRYTGPDNSTLSIPSPLVIPAKGSMTISMTATLPEAPERTNLSLWLATSQDAGISAPVDITVQTQKGLSGRSGIAIGLVIVLAAILLGRVLILRKRKKNARLMRQQRAANSTTTSEATIAAYRNRAQQSAREDVTHHRRRQPRRGGDKSTGDSMEPS